MAAPDNYRVLASRWEFYSRYTKSGLQIEAAGSEAFVEQGEMIHDQLRAFVLSSHYPCVGARSAFNQDGYRFGFFPNMSTPEATAGLHASLLRFVAEQPNIDAKFSTFVAVFAGPLPRHEADFEDALWQQLADLHELDRTMYDWDPRVSSDPDHVNFSFSVGGRAYFVVGMNPASSRKARCFGWPALVFNAHYMFEELRNNGQYDRFKVVIRERDKKLQHGDINPNLTDFGVASEARQYSGKKVEAAWKCPFLAKLAAKR